MNFLFKKKPEVKPMVFKYCEIMEIKKPFKEGDIVDRPMLSGKVGVFRITNVKQFCDFGEPCYWSEVFIGYRGLNPMLPLATTEPRGVGIGV